jgi:hypothetical protein
MCCAEAVARKQRRRDQDPAAVVAARHAQAGVIDLVARQRQAMQRWARAIRLKAESPPNTTLGKSTKTSCAIGEAATRLRRWFWFGIRRFAVGHTTGTFFWR